MSKDIEMFQISDKQAPVGTEIFDKNLPSSIDFDQKMQNHPEQKPNNHQSVAQMGKVLVIGDQLKSFRVRGKPLPTPPPHYSLGQLIKSHAQLQPIKIFDETSAGLRSWWDSIVGYMKREGFIGEGHLYLFVRKKEGLQLQALIQLTKLFKIFVDPEEERIRLVLQQGQQLYNRQLGPTNYFVMLEQINRELNKYGLYLTQ